MPAAVSNTTSNATSDLTRRYLAIYAGIIGANTLFTLARAFLFAHGGIKAAVNVHRLLIAKILKVIVIHYLWSF